ncbi:uncharacterized protein [Halyomorpha halys]|uniref:uncharacterized protein n=1 Tax=Halyomorpha halys TaxID=286706 RepID=UPI0006D4E31C|nr:4-coumarate--CoA ligase 1-like [Halyomorpha halys]
MFTCRWLRRAGRAISRLSVETQKRQNSQYILESTIPRVNIPSQTIQDRVFEHMERWPEHTALECCMSGRSYTYGQLDEFSRRVAAGYLKSGLRPGQVVSFVLPNIPEFIIALLGALRAGLVVSTINPIYGNEEIGYQINNSDSALVLTFMLKLDEVKTAVSKMDKKPIITVIHQPGDEVPDGIQSFMELFMVDDDDQKAVDKVKVDPDHLALLLYSSGTTGLPKGVRLTHRNIISNIVQVDTPETSPIIETTADYQDIIACVLPFFHVYGLVIGSLSYLSKGCKLLTLPRFEPDMYLRALKEQKTTLAHVVPPLVQFLANHPAVTASHLDTLRFCMNGAAAVSQTDANKLLEKKKSLRLLSGYGLTEASPVITVSKNTSTNLISVGHIVPNTEIKIVDTETGKIKDSSTPGEICVRGPQVMDGYHKNEQATKETIIDGWLHTGDVGYFDKDGQMFIVDRIKELIKVKGFQVAPLELEEILREHPGVADCGVVGRPDKRFGEVPVAFVVPSKKKPTTKELQDYVAAKVAEYKQISEVVFIEAIPKNLTGKILRKNLKEMLTQG